MGEGVSQEQLKLLMDSYKDSVALTTKLLVKLDTVVESQKENCQSMKILCTKIDHQTDVLTEANLKINDKLSENRTESLKEHSSIKGKIYIAFSLMGTIIVSLISLIVILMKSLPP